MFRDFFRTIRSYTFGEKLASAVLCLVFLFSTWSVFTASTGIGGGGTYVEGAVGRILVINPLFTNYNELDHDVSRLVFSGLMKYDAEKGKMVDDLANVKLNEDQTLYTFTIRDGAVFHNGEPVTAEDVYFTYHDVIQSEEFPNSVLRANFEGIAVTKKDDKTVQFQVTQPNSFFLTNLSVGILPKSIYGEVPVGDLLMSTVNKQPVGSGPYKVSDSYAVNSRGDGKLTLTRFDSYYGGLPHIETIVLRTYSSFERLSGSLGDIDAIGKVSGDSVNTLKDSPFTLHSYQLPQYKAAFFNTSRPFVRERSVRLALQKSVDKGALLQQIPNTVAVDTPFMELKQDEWIYKVDVAEAQGALFDAGYKYDDPNKKGVRKNKKGTPLEIKLVYFEKADKGRKESEDALTAAYLKAAWEAIGVGVIVEPHSPEERSEIVRNRDYDVLIAGESLGYDLDTYFFWHSSQAVEGGSNLSNYRNFSADALIEDVRRYVDEDRKAKRVTQLAKIVSGDVPALFLYRPVYFYATNEKFSGYKLDHLAFPADRFFNIQLWK